MARYSLPFVSSQRQAANGKYLTEGLREDPLFPVEEARELREMTHTSLRARILKKKPKLSEAPKQTSKTEEGGHQHPSTFACEGQGAEARRASAAAANTLGRPGLRSSRGQVKLPGSALLRRLRSNLRSRAAPILSRALAPPLRPPSPGSKPRSPPVPQRHPRPPQRERRSALALRAAVTARAAPGHLRTPAGTTSGRERGPAAPSGRPPGAAPRSYPARGISWRSSVRVISFVL